MEKEFVTYEIALKLKELGFDEKCMASYYTYDIKNFSKGKYDYRGKFEFDYSTEDQYIVNSNETYYVSAPLWQQAISWLKNECKLEIEVFKWVAKCYHNEELATPHYLFDIDKAFEYTNDWIYQSINDDLKYHTYEEAREQAILKAIELIKINHERPL